MIAIIGIVAAIGIPNLLNARRSAHESAAIGTLRTCANAEFTYSTNTNSYGNLTDLNAAQLIDSSISEATSAATAKAGYVFYSTALSGTFSITAERSTAGSGSRDFSIIEDGVIYSGIVPSAATRPLPAGFTPIGTGGVSGS